MEMKEGQAGSIQIIGARTHNLKNINLEIPKNALVVITGVSGSGKSSLAFDTIYAEGQRRYIESLSIQARQFLDQLPKPQVVALKGLSPSIAIDQEPNNRNPRSTVGTVTEIYEFLKLLFARIGAQSGNSKAKLEPNNFSFNSPYGMCPGCNGKGIQLKIDKALLMDEDKTILEGAILPWASERDQYYEKLLHKVCQEFGINADIPLKKQPKEAINKLFYGIPEQKFKIHYKNSTGKYRTRTVPFEGIIHDIDERFRTTPSASMKEKLARFMREQLCTDCHGYKLRKESLEVKIQGYHIGQLSNITISELQSFCEELESNANNVEQEVAIVILGEIKRRLTFMEKAGIGYLTLDRSISTLSGGEMQRTRLASQMGSELSGVIYVFDEPSIGLHPRDTNQLLLSLKELRDMGNTVIVVEHDEDIMMQADYLIDVGPGAGKDGGELLAIGSPLDVMKDSNSLTGKYLSKQLSIPHPQTRRKPTEFLRFRGCTEHNLKNIDVDFPLGVFVAVTGVSGSGKSTLVNDIVYKALVQKSERIPGITIRVQEAEGIHLVNKMIKVNQSPIGRTPRSNPATYTGLFDDIREIFASAPQAKKRGFGKGRFSFNVEGGRCEECLGDGQITFEMKFFSNVYVTCPVCKGKRFNDDTLQIKYNGHNIADILELTVIDSITVFKDHPKILLRLETLHAVGLGYLKLGQSSTTLSGGEAQRIKLASYLWKRPEGNTVYILDEPTTGLHFADISRLIDVLQTLVEEGNTVIVIEHNLDVIKCVDHVIDLGPKGGKNGGYIIGVGTPEEISNIRESYTGMYLKKIFK
ncbi:excinuclease ABC subunit UvrA [Brevibacillus brevis]|nr:excinuclease ABC subunit UvrA [Brevibacillus brevis]